MIFFENKRILLFVIFLLYCVDANTLRNTHGNKPRQANSAGCTLPDDQRYKYVDMNDTEIKPGEKVAVGMKLKVQCKFFDMYSFLTYDYENDTYYENSEDTIITCIDDSEMSQHTLKCPEEDKNDKCMKIENGEVRQSNGYYIVSCNDGFSLDTIVPEGTRCNCNNGSLTSIIGGQPKCLPDPCVVPYDYDPPISMSSRDFVSFSGGSVVSVGEIVYFNCSKASELIYEPLNRRFKCLNGLWIEDERDKTWQLGNNGTFPKCRKAICEQKCQNEGVCSKDNYCRCKHLTRGKLCEHVICDNECMSNGGKCIGPGKCECPLGKFGNQCQHLTCNKVCKSNGGKCIGLGKCECPQGRFGTKCEHNHCVVPYDFDSLISILNKDRTSLSGGSVVKVGETVNFDCSNASGLIQEPINRRFKCVNGLWIEDEPDKTWKFGNNGTFPKCRKTKCEQKCQNGGVCLKDNECRCENWTRGKLCEKVICDKECKSNGGKCIGPGKCECPQGKFGTKCEHKSTANTSQMNVSSAQNNSKDQGKDQSKEENENMNTESENPDVSEVKNDLTSEQDEGCTLSDDHRYKYMDINDKDIKPGENVAVGMTLKVQCKFPDLYSFLTYDYETVTDIENDTDIENSEGTIIICNDDNEMSQHILKCPEADKIDKCMKIENGEVRQSNGYYIVSCNDGFSLDTIAPEGKRCTCINGSLTSIIGDQPKCLPDPCVVPPELDSLITISYNNSTMLSGGVVVEVGETVYFNCTKQSELKYEPLNRRFKCVNGLWIEDEKDKTWKLGNNGTFPKCRKAICNPKCQNEGVCSKDNNCRCKNLTKGKFCEQVICDDDCISNGGKCIVPGKCDCPTGKKGDKCQHGIDDCIGPFGSELKWFPIWDNMNNFFLGRKALKNLSACQKACIKYGKDCGGVYYNGNKKVQSCHGFSKTKEQYFKTRDEGWTGTVYIRKCKDEM